MAEISVARQQSADDTASCEVTVAEGDGKTSHHVTVSQRQLERLSAPDEPPEEFVRRCFEFLIERESKESIMSEFDVSIISYYFPEFERDITQ